MPVLISHPFTQILDFKIRYLTDTRCFLFLSCLLHIKSLHSRFHSLRFLHFHSRSYKKLFSVFWTRFVLSFDWQNIISCVIFTFSSADLSCLPFSMSFWAAISTYPFLGVAASQLQLFRTCALKTSVRIFIKNALHVPHKLFEEELRAPVLTNGEMVFESSVPLLIRDILEVWLSRFYMKIV